MLKLCIACSSKVSEIDPLKLTIKNIQFSGLSTNDPVKFSQCSRLPRRNAKPPISVIEF